MIIDDVLDLSARFERLSTSFYGYLPDRTIIIVFLVLFAVSTVTHVGQAVIYRTWWMFGTAVFCGILEILGWSGRLWSTSNAALAAPYEMQLTCTILAPTPLLAANFVIMEKLIMRLGAGYSRLSPKWYLIVFCCCDVISLVIQAVGGGLAATAVATRGDPEKGGHIMLGGIVFQMATITVYALCATEFFTRYILEKPLAGRVSTRGNFTTKLKLLSGAVAFTTVCLFIRAVYRTIELADGWTGRIISTEIYFNVLDGAMIILAVYTHNFLHHGLLLRETGVKNVDPEKKEASEADPSLIASAMTLTK